MARYTKQEAKEWARETLKGQWTTLTTPFTSDNRVDEAGLRRNIRHIRRLGTRGAGCCWGMGEFWSLSREERIQIMDIVADEARGQWPIGAHVTHTSLPEMLALARHAEDAGFDLLIVAPPYIAAKTDDQVIEWVRLLADHTSLGIMFYNSPQFNIVVSPQNLQRMCQIPNVVGVKEASFNQQLSIETHLLAGKNAVISTPDEWIFWKAKELGFQQQVMFANTSDWRFDTPECNHYVQFIEKATQGNLDEQFYDKHLRRLNELSDAWWTRTVDKFNGTLPVAMVKYWGELMGLAGGPVRAPLPSLTEEEKSRLKRELEPLKPRPPRPAAVAASTSAVASGRAGWITGNNNFASGMLLMVSVQDVEEALEAERGGADVVDVKNLQEALVGSGHPSIVRQVRAQIPADKHVSVTLGVVPNQPGTVAMAVHAAALLNATSVKVGFCTTEYDRAVEILQQSRRALEGSNTKLVGSLFADNHLYPGGLDPHLMVRLAKEGQCDGFLVDTLTKDGRNLFDFLSETELREMVFQGKQLGLSTALSGHLKIDDLDELARINPDIVGVRGAVCADGDRGRAVAWQSVARFKHEVDRRKSGELPVHTGAAAAAASGNGHSGGWAVVDGRGKSCAGVIAALTQQVSTDPRSFVEAILGDALNIYDVMLWAERAGHKLLTQRKEPDGSLRVLIQP
ncbi:MAG: hypothetical protein EXR54_06515 [Dehalococcoidia bacterium]|nr:hypothetical protein [Dehalococcoidia bacterium]MSQ17205.1 hypothetical protein [Dehalococcoidia bacterium]